MLNYLTLLCCEMQFRVLVWTVVWGRSGYIVCYIFSPFSTVLLCWRERERRSIYAFVLENSEVERMLHISISEVIVNRLIEQQHRKIFLAICTYVCIKTAFDVCKSSNKANFSHRGQVVQHTELIMRNTFKRGECTYIHYYIHITKVSIKFKTVFEGVDSVAATENSKMTRSLA